MKQSSPVFVPTRSSLLAREAIRSVTSPSPFALLRCSFIALRPYSRLSFRKTNKDNGGLSAVFTHTLGPLYHAYDDPQNTASKSLLQLVVLNILLLPFVLSFSVIMSRFGPPLAARGLTSSILLVCVTYTRSCVCVDYIKWRFT